MRTKLTALLLLTGVTIGTFAWCFLGAESDRPAAAAGVTLPVIPAALEPPAPPLPLPSVAPLASMRLAPVEPEAIPPDPFQPIVGPPVVRTNDPRQRVPTNDGEGATTLAQGGTSAVIVGPLLPVGPPPVKSNSILGPSIGDGRRESGGSLSAVGGQVTPSSRDDIQLKGIIRGRPNVVLVRCEGQTYFVKEGERFAGTWEVRRIQDNSAVLVKGDRVLELQIEGGSQ